MPSFSTFLTLVIIYVQFSLLSSSILVCFFSKTMVCIITNTLCCNVLSAIMVLFPFFMFLSLVVFRLLPFH